MLWSPSISEAEDERSQKMPQFGISSAGLVTDWEMRRDNNWRLAVLAPIGNEWSLHLTKNRRVTAPNAELNINRVSSSRSETVSLDFVQDIYEQGRESVSSDLLVRVIHAVKVLMRNDLLGLLEMLLRDIDFSSVAPEAVVALIRTSSPVRSKLMNWRPAVKRAQHEFSQRGLDADRILVGLQSGQNAP